MVYIYYFSGRLAGARRRLDVALGAEAKRRCVEMVEEGEEEVHDRSLVAEIFRSGESLILMVIFLVISW